MSNIENEQHYIDMSNQLKSRYDEYEKENRKLKEEMYDIKKELMSIYGLIKIIDNFHDNYIIETDEKLQFLIETLRSLCSGVIDTYILE